jgi:hypothetical protein
LPKILGGCLNAGHISTHQKVYVCFQITSKKKRITRLINKKSSKKCFGKLTCEQLLNHAISHIAFEDQPTLRTSTSINFQHMDVHILRKNTRKHKNKDLRLGNSKGENHLSTSCGRIPCDTNRAWTLIFLLIILRYSLTYLILPILAFFQRRLAISLPDPGLAASKSTSRLQRAPQS